jgi:hypothetical protein
VTIEVKQPSPAIKATTFLSPPCLMAVVNSKALLPVSPFLLVLLFLPAKLFFLCQLDGAREE